MRMGFEAAVRIPSRGCNDAVTGWRWTEVGFKGRTKIGPKERAEIGLTERADIELKENAEIRPEKGRDWAQTVHSPPSQMFE